MRESSVAVAKKHKESASHSGETTTMQFLPPPRPRRKLFFALLAVFFAWLGVLMWMYWATVR
jgi:hypothetical protein